MRETGKTGTPNFRREDEGDKEDKDNFQQKMTYRMRETRKTETPTDRK